jgi:hypothetical protein
MVQCKISAKIIARRPRRVIAYDIRKAKWVLEKASPAVIVYSLLFYFTHLLYIICRLCNKCICSVSTGP